MGKTITLTSGADGSVLAVDPETMTLVNVAADSPVDSRNVRFQVLDLGKGRVALKAASGRFVSVAGDSASLEDSRNLPKDTR